ncbi:hypothetical protein [Embleya sp. AB8]|uniref:hypothetical protein n=1 Tax=Embleya sp. AB8 TaxID=3156304 RepID=UPI003C72B78B
MPHVPNTIGGVSPAAHAMRTEHALSALRVEWALKLGQRLKAASPMGNAEGEWFRSGAAWLQPGSVFSAVAVPAPLIHAAVDRRSPEEAAAPLAEALDGPVYYRPSRFDLDEEYTVLLSVSDGEAWDMPPTRRIGTHAFVRVPAPGRYRPRVDGDSWWVVPATGPDLCTAARLAALLDAGWQRNRCFTGGRGD